MSQRSIEKLLGKILTDEGFRREFFPVRPSSFDLAAAHGFDLTSVERSALATLRLRRFDYLAKTLDPRISRCVPDAEDPVETPAGKAEPQGTLS